MPALVQHLAQLFRLLDRDSTDQHGRPASCVSVDLVHHRAELGSLGPVDAVGVILPDHRLVGRDRHDFELVDLHELLGFGGRRTGHARQLGIQAEVVLDRDRREGLALRLHLDALFGLDGFVQTLGVAAALHQAARELVHDHHFNSSLGLSLSPALTTLPSCHST